MKNPSTEAYRSQQDAIEELKTQFAQLQAQFLSTQKEAITQENERLKDQLARAVLNLHKH